MGETTNPNFGGTHSMGSRTFAQVLAGDVPDDVPADMLAELQDAVRAMSVDDGPDAWDAEGNPRLVVAVRAKDKAAVERLLAAGADVNAPGAYGRTALQAAAEDRNQELVDLLVAAGARADAIKLTDLFSWRFKHGDLVKALLAAGARVTGAEIEKASNCEDRASLELFLAARADIRAALEALLAAVTSIGNDAPARCRAAWAMAPNDDLTLALHYQAPELSAGTVELSKRHSYVEAIEKLLGR